MRFAGNRWWGLGVGIFFTLMLIPVGVGVAEAMTGPGRVIALALLTVYGVTYLVLPTMLWTRSLWERLAAMAFMTAVGSALVVTLGSSSMPILAYAMAIGALMLPPLWSIVICGSIVAVYAVVAALDENQPWGPWAALLSVAVALTLMGMLVRSNQALLHARHELAALAVARERARVARDLHDVLGHSLTLLAVKASLARRLLGKGLVEPAVAEIADIERQAREALVDVRATVSGYREASLAAEVAGARVALEAGQIEATVSGDLDSVPPHLREAFAYVVREAVTNVIRHSASRSCLIQIGSSYVEIVDEGGPVVPAAGDGNGLTGLRQRLEAVGGRLLAGPVPGGGFRLRAEVAAS
ncbi:MAG TPA: histidine kinase [Candidatus Limnocylindrales bacterium]|nr:histidine kinase [Candidatus Limnocylindrales bacterium]